MNKTETNPYANLDGSPKDDKLKEFWEWEEKKTEEYLSSLSPEERKEKEEAMKSLSRKMNS